jgi:hypothetical protein
MTRVDICSPLSILTAVEKDLAFTTSCSEGGSFGSGGKLMLPRGCRGRAMGIVAAWRRQSGERRR